MAVAGRRKARGRRTAYARSRFTVHGFLVRVRALGRAGDGSGVVLGARKTAANATETNEPRLQGHREHMHREACGSQHCLHVHQQLRMPGMWFG